MSKVGLFLDEGFFDGRRYSVHDQSFILFVRVAQKGYWPVIFRRRRVFPGFQYGDDLRFPPYCWDLVLSVWYVEAVVIDTWSGEVCCMFV